MGLIGGSPLPTTYVPDADTLVRYVKPSLVMRNPETGAVEGVFPDAFRLRAEDHGALSCAWLEHYAGTRSEQLLASIAQFKVALSVKKSAVFAVGNAGAIKSACSKYDVGVRIVHAPEANHEAHAEVRRFQDQEEELLALLAEDAWSELHPA